MGSKSRVDAEVRAALTARTVEEKLNAIARAISQLGDFVDDIENQIRRLPQ